MHIKLKLVLVAIRHLALNQTENNTVRGTEKIHNILILPFFVLFSVENCQGIYINVLC